MTPGSWETVPIEDVCEILDRLRKPITKRDRKPGPIPYYGASGVLDHVEGYIFDEQLVLLGEDGAKWEPGENSAFPINGKTWVNNHAHVIRPDRNRLLDAWLIYYLNYEDLTEYVSGLTVPKLNQKSLKAIPIPLPPLSEQRRIVSVLDAAFAGLATATAHTQKNLQNARELFETNLNTLTSSAREDWQEAIVGDACNFIDYRGKTPTKTDSGLRLITAKNVRMGYLRREPEEFVEPQSYDGWMTRGIPKKGDVLFTTEAPLGLVAQLDTDEKVVFAQRIITLQPDPGRIDSTFFKYLLMSRTMQDRIHAKGTGATAKGIKASLLKKIPFSYAPDINEQRRIATTLDSLSEAADRMKEVAENKLAALSELKQSLLHRAFRGELSGGAVTEQISEATA